MGVWIETQYGIRRELFSWSHPAWVCGLKRIFRREAKKDNLSHPAWVCGLKHVSSDLYGDLEGHTLRGCVD